MNKKTVGIIGGGAAGLFSAIIAARQGVAVTIIEGSDRVGKKILSTGNGKCNLGNLALDASAYYGADEKWITQTLKYFDAQDTIQFFQGIGLLIKNKNGYLYPACEQASAVLDVLRIECKSLGVQVILDRKVTDIYQKEGSDKIIVKTKEEAYQFDSVILSCGGKAAPKTGSDGSGYTLAKKMGHHLVPTVPALVQLRCKEDYLKAVAGVRADAEITVYCEGEAVVKERGELQLTDYGISGIPVFQISRVVNYILKEGREVTVNINLFPDYSKEDMEQLRVVRSLLQDERSIEEYMTGLVNKKIMLLFMKLAGLKPGEPVVDADLGKIKKFFSLCQEWKVHVVGSNPYDNAQVCAGGVDTKEITGNMESKKMQGVYFAGEIMDVDGKCGGYNLQWAWSSGYLAGMAASGYPVIKVEK